MRHYISNLINHNIPESEILQHTLLTASLEDSVEKIIQDPKYYTLVNKVNLDQIIKEKEPRSLVIKSKKGVPELQRTGIMCKKNSPWTNIISKGIEFLVIKNN